MYFCAEKNIIYWKEKRFEIDFINYILNIKILVYLKKEQQENLNFLDNLIFPIQTHSSNIIEIKTGKKKLSNCNSIFTKRTNDLKL